MKPRASYPLEFIAASSCLVGLAVALMVVGVNFSKADKPGKLNASAIQAVSNNKTASIDVPVHYLGLTQAGCAASTCHGQPSGDEPSWKNAALIFERDDPHAKAYDVLFSERSKQIIARLTRQETNELDPYLKVLEQQCIGCHATMLPPGVAASSPAGLAELSHGVSCESCHGPSSDWRDAHLTKAWPAVLGGKGSQLLYQDYPSPADDFVVLNNPRALAAKCVECHLGSAEPAKQVTHDFLAAGHPKLDIEVSAWRNKLPQHWSAKPIAKDSQHHTAFWIQGQFASAKQQLHLANTQLTGSQNEQASVIWPEFSHLECASCHQNLRISSDQSVASETAIRIADHGWLASISFSDRVNAKLLLSVFELNQAVDTSAIQQAEVSDFFKYQKSRPLSVSQLGQLLQTHRLEIKSWDRLIAWTYAAQAVLRDAENGEFDKYIVKDLRDSLQKLSDQIEAAVTSRYASPKGRPLDANSETMQQIQHDINEVAKTLALLFPNTPK